MADLPSDDEHGPEIKTGPDLLALTHKAIPDFKTPTPARKRLEFLDDQFLGQHSHYPMIWNLWQFDMLVRLCYLLFVQVSNL